MLRPGDLNRFYEQLGQHPADRRAAAAAPTPGRRRVRAGVLPPGAISKTEVRAVALAKNIAEGGTRLFAEGDSWFDFPNWILLDPVSDVLDGLIHGHGYVVERISHGGDTLETMAYPGNLRLIRQNLAGLRPKAFLLSGGGNDLCGRRQDGTNRFYDVLAGPPAPHGIQSKLLSHYLDQLVVSYRQILAEAAAARVPAFVHAYAHAIPSGIPAVYKFRVGPWLRPQLKAKGYDPATEGVRLVARMINDLSDRLDALAKGSRGKVHFVDLRRVITKDDWHDELHLLPQGWRKAAAEFDRVIRMVLS